MQPNPRYAGKPLLRLLELYVLWAIGELSETDEASLVHMTPKLQALYGSSSEWQEIVASTVQMGPGMPEQLEVLWKRNLEIARQSNSVLTPQQFAEMIVDENFRGEPTGM